MCLTSAPARGVWLSSRRAAFRRRGSTPSMCQRTRSMSRRAMLPITVLASTSNCIGAICSGRSERRVYDLIISNPPYVDAEGMAELPRECRAEPKLALDGGADGLDVVRRILKQARRHLTSQGGLLCEIGRGRERLEAAFPQLPLLWLDTEDSEGEVFWVGAADL